MKYIKLIDLIGLNQNFIYRYRYGHPDDNDNWNNQVHAKLENSKPVVT